MMKDISKLENAIRNGQNKYSTVWRNNWNNVRNHLISVINNIIKEIETPKDIWLWKTDKEDIDDIVKLFWFLEGIKGIEKGSYDNLRDFLEALVNATSKDEIITLVDNYRDKIKGAGYIALFSWASIVKPEYFAPLWGSEKKAGVLNKNNIHDLDLKEIQKIKNNIDRYTEFLDDIEAAARNVGIDSVLEAAFYLMKYQV